MYRIFTLAAALGLVGLAGANPAMSVPARPIQDTHQLEVLKLDEITGRDALRATIQRLSSERRQKIKQLVEAGVSLAKQKDTPLGYNAAFVLLNLCDEIYDFESAEVLYRFCMERAKALKSVVRQWELREVMMGLAMRTRQFTVAERLGKEMLELKTDVEEYETWRKPVILLEMVIVYAYLNQLDQAKKILDGMKSIPGLNQQPLVRLREAWLLRFTGEYKKAAEIYEQVLGQLEGNHAADLLRYQLASLYAEMNDVDKATQYLQALLKKEPDNPSYNNDLGYIWVDHDRNLDEAEKMIRKALQKEPENAAYLDSLAWVYYKKKQFAEAKKLLLQAVALPDGQHPELYDHLGDVHKALGEHKQAIEAWKKAIETASPSHRDQQIKRQAEKKIQQVQLP